MVVNLDKTHCVIELNLTFDEHISMSMNIISGNRVLQEGSPNLTNDQRKFFVCEEPFLT